MKKLILPLMMLAVSIPSFGQIVRSTTFAQREKRIDWYVRLGLSCNNLTGDAVSEVKDAIKEEKRDPGDNREFEAGFGTRANFDIEFGFNRFFGRTDLYWGMELGLGTRGGSYHAYQKSPTYEGEDKCWVNTYGVKYVPFQLGYKFPVNDDIKIDAHLGVWLEYDFAGSYTEDEWAKWSTWGNSDNEETYKRSWGYYDDHVNGIGIDAGLQLGIGVWFKRFNLNFTWQRGFAPMMDFPFGDHVYNKDGDRVYYNSSNAIISLGVSF